MDAFVDKSWTLHYTSTNSNSYRDLFTHSSNQNHLSRYFDQIPNFIASQKPQYKDDLNDESEKLGPLRECKYTISTLSVTTSSTSTSTSTTSHPTHSQKKYIHIELHYQHTTFAFILYTPHLILSKAQPSHTKHIVAFLSDTFSISIDPLKLPSRILRDSLQRYITTLTVHVDRTDDLHAEKRAAILRTAIGTLKLTVSFAGPVAPHLKTVDLGVPYETVDSLATSSSSSSSGDGFVQSLVEHLHLQTGLKLPLATNDEDEVDAEDEYLANGRGGSVASKAPFGPPVRLSKVMSAAFAVSVDGRLRFAAKAIEYAIDQEVLVVAANISLLDDIVTEARRRGTTNETEGVSGL